MLKSLIKPLIIFTLILVMLIPVSMVRSIIQDRVGNRDTAKESIASSWAKEQTISGPWIVLRYETYEKTTMINEKTGVNFIDSKKVERFAYYRPTDLNINGMMDVSYRYRNIFKVPTYQANIAINAKFDLTALKTFINENNQHQFTDAWLSFNVSDARGFKERPSIKINNSLVAAEPNGDGFFIRLAKISNKNYSAEKLNNNVLTVEAHYNLGGVDNLSVNAIGLDNHISLHSTWPHPSFAGDFLPTQRKISDKGFSANWSISSFATGVSSTPTEASGSEKRIVVSLMDPIDIYVLNDRASKYAALFIVLIFGVFYLFELLKSSNVHPIKYGMVGLATAVFFLLLLSFSEKISFIPAYIIAAIASISLISIYMWPNFGRKGGLILTGLLTLLFTAIFIILESEYDSLLLGSVLSFITLATIMMLTRKMDSHNPRIEN